MKQLNASYGLPYIPNRWPRARIPLYENTHHHFLRLTHMTHLLDLFRTIYGLFNFPNISTQCALFTQNEQYVYCPLHLKCDVFLKRYSDAFKICSQSTKFKVSFRIRY